MSGTTIIRRSPRGRRMGSLTAAGFALPVPSLPSLTRTHVHQVGVTIRAYRGLVLGLALSGALLWPLTLAGLFVAAPPTADFFRAQRSPTPEEITRWFFLAGLAPGLIAGVLQWRLLCAAGLRAPFWIFATVAGWTLGIAGMARAVTPLSAWLRSVGPAQRFSFWAPQWERYVFLALIGALLGIVLGAAQWAALRPTQAPLRQRGLWFVATAIAWAAGMALVPLMPQAPYFVQNAGRFSGGFDATLPGLVLAGALYGLLTALSLIFLLRRASPQPLET